jgi:hypothetical protein
VPNFDPNRVNLRGQTRKWYYEFAITPDGGVWQDMLAPWLLNADRKHLASGN